MKRITLVLLSVATIMTAVGAVMAQQERPVQLQQIDPVINFRIPLSKASSIIYAVRYSTILYAKDANELADLMVQQANDTTLNKPVKMTPPTPPVTRPKPNKE